MRAGPAAAVGGVLAGLGLLPLTPAAPAFADGDDCSSIRSGSPSEASTMPSAALEALQISEAHQLLRRRGIESGEGQTVAIVDSGIVPGGSGPGFSAVPETEVDFYQGTALAGLVVGPPLPPDDPDAEPVPVGIAPGAAVIDVRVYEALEPTGDEQGVESSDVAAGLRWIAENARRRSIDIANVSLRVRRDDEELKQAIKAVTEAGVIVVAAAGDLPTDEGPDREVFVDEAGDLRDGIDARQYVWPAGYDDVVAVSATTPTGESSTVLPNSAIDVAVPTAGGVSIGLNREPCQLDEISSRVAAAEVSAVLAMLASAFPRETDEQVLTRLYDTATGSTRGRFEPSTGSGVPDDPTDDRLTGAGVVQPVEALLRPLTPGRDGSLDTVEIAEEETEAEAPREQPDVLAQIREDAVWFGLLAGGVLAVALMLRPVLSRR